jgi:hypothetical protein
MHIPGFTAATTLNTPGSVEACTTERIAPLPLGSRPIRFPPLQCCGIDPFSGKPRCITRPWSPVEHCVCKDTSAGPSFDCRPLVLTSGR